VASTYPLLGGAEGDGAGLQGELLRPSDLRRVGEFQIIEDICNHFGSIVYSFGSSR